MLSSGFFKGLRRFMATAKPNPKLNNEYDALVIGGGTGGISFAKAAASEGLKVALLEYVQPSLKGSTWGLGGTCLNVGCVPKKIMHTSAIYKTHISKANRFGWESIDNKDISANIKLNWNKLVENVQEHIKSSNYSYNNTLKKLGIDYLNAKGRLVDKNTVEYKYKNIEKNPFEKVHAKNIIIATGSRPNMSVMNPEYWVTSDDLFSLEEEPGKTFVYGGGYVGVECAGFLKELGYEVGLATLGNFLVQFDRDMVDIILKDLNDHKMEVFEDIKLESVVKKGERNFDVTFSIKDKRITRNYNTLLLAIGRVPSTNIGLEKAGIRLAKNKKILGKANEKERSVTVDNIYGVGDCLYGVPELMPVAGKAGKLLAKRVAERLKGKSEEEIIDKYSMDYDFIPTTLFTPKEFSSVGLTEDQAKMVFEEQNIDVYHTRGPPLEEYVMENKQEFYIKLICQKNKENKVLGIQYIGPYASEIIGGYAIALKNGLYKKQLDSSVGVHPSISEEFVTLNVTKKDNPNFKKTSC